MKSVEEIRKDFPILSEEVNGHPVIYLDNAATTQMPLCVLERIKYHYYRENANVHRGIHTLSERSTCSYEKARETVRQFLGAKSVEEVIFTQGTTDAVNMAAQGLESEMAENDTIVVTELEHHSNFLPWQRLCQRTGAALEILPCPNGNPDMDEYDRLMRKKPKLVAVTQVSNLTGTVMPLEEMTGLAHEAGAMVFVDGAQGVRHQNTDVVSADFDFYCFSGHKIMGPAGIGVLYGKRCWLERMEPARVGGGMVDTVTADSFTNGPLPSRLEAGTPNYPGAIGLTEALCYLNNIGRREIAAYEHELISYAERKLSEIEGLTILGNPDRREGVISFTLDQIHSYDAASVLDKLGVALRSGTHCAQPGLRRFGLSSALRLSTAFYNTREEIDQTCLALCKTREVMSRWMKK